MTTTRYSSPNTAIKEIVISSKPAQRSSPTTILILTHHQGSEVNSSINKNQLSRIFNHFWSHKTFKVCKCTFLTNHLSLAVTTNWSDTLDPWNEPKPYRQWHHPKSEHRISHCFSKYEHHWQQPEPLVPCVLQQFASCGEFHSQSRWQNECPLIQRSVLSSVGDQLASSIQQRSHPYLAT